MICLQDEGGAHIVQFTNHDYKISMFHLIIGFPHRKVQCIRSNENEHAPGGLLLLPEALLVDQLNGVQAIRAGGDGAIRTRRRFGAPLGNESRMLLLLEGSGAIGAGSGRRGVAVPR